MAAAADLLAVLQQRQHPPREAVSAAHRDRPVAAEALRGHRRHLGRIVVAVEDQAAEIGDVAVLQHAVADKRQFVARAPDMLLRQREARLLPLRELLRASQLHGGELRARVVHQTRQHAPLAAHRDESLPQAALRHLSEPEVAVVGNLHNRFKLRKHRLRAFILRVFAQPPPIDECPAVIRVDHGPLAIAVALEGALVVVEEEGAAGVVP